jgi:hypothetical protein
MYVSNDQAEKDPGRSPPGPWVAHGVELAPEGQQHRQHSHGGRALDAVAMHQVDRGAERQQNGGGLPRTAFPAPEPMRKH